MTRSDYFRFRTGASGWTDDELLLFDALFTCCGAGARQLSAKEYRRFTNFHVTHSLSNQELVQRLRDWSALGLLESVVEPDPHPYRQFWLTSLGGALWESERLPVWERFYDTLYHSCNAGYSFLHNNPPRPRPRHGEELLVITSPGRRIPGLWVRTATRHRLHRTIKRWTMRRIADWEPLGWRAFPTAWQLSVRVKASSGTCSGATWGGDEDWEGMRRDRQAWRGCEELVELRLDGKLPWPA